MSALTAISAARTALILDHPFFGALALRLKAKEAPEVTRTIATDGRTLAFASEYVQSLKPAELVGLLAHEVMHAALQHHTRRDGRDPVRWNQACDYAVNPLLVASGLTLPPGAHVDAQYSGKSAEQIYTLLPLAPPKGGGSPNQGNGGTGNQDNANGAPAPGSDALADMPGAILDAPEPAQDAAEWQVAVSQAAKAAQMMGRLPAGMKAAIAEQTKPVIDWRAMLRRFVQQTATADYSWRMPNRRYMAGGLYLPELRSEAMPPVVLVIDTSGSITDATLAAFRGECQAIIDECAPERTHVVYCDAKVAHADTFERGEPLVMERHGGGGTDFRPAFDYVTEQEINPACVVYLTDGEGRYPEHAPDYPTLWAMTSDTVAPWGETVRMMEEAR